MRAWMLRKAQTSLLLISSPECPHSCKPVSVSPVAVFPAFLPPTVYLAALHCPLWSCAHLLPGITIPLKATRRWALSTWL